jgi:transmembrane sensor
MPRSNYDKLVDQYLKGQLPEDEKKKFEAWLDMKKTRRTEDFVITPEDEERVYKQIISRAEGIKELEPLLKRPNRMPLVWAASIALILGIGAYVSWTAMRSGTPEQITATSTEKMILNDGSIVWLHVDSKLFYSESAVADTRFVKLTGEAFFEVAKDPSRPFVIECGNSKITVLGTAFSLKSRNDSLSLIVMSGKVHVETGTKEIDLLPGQQLVYSGAGDLEPAAVSDEVKASVIENTEFDMKFNDATLSEITTRIARKFNVKVSLEEDAAGNCHLTGDFTDCSLNTTLSMISEVLDITFMVAGDEVTIAGNGCAPN